MDERVRRQTTKLESANDLLRHQLAELETLYRQLAVGLCFLDADFRFLRINDALAAVNGAPVDAHIGRPLREMLPSAWADVLEPLYRRVFETGEALLDYELTSPAPADPTVEREWTIGCTPVRAGDGTVLGLQ